MTKQSVKKTIGYVLLVNLILSPLHLWTYWSAMMSRDLASYGVGFCFLFYGVGLAPFYYGCYFIGRYLFKNKPNFVLWVYICFQALTFIAWAPVFFGTADFQIYEPQESNVNSEYEQRISSENMLREKQEMDREAFLQEVDAYDHIVEMRVDGGKVTLYIKNDLSEIVLYLYHENKHLDAVSRYKAFDKMEKYPMNMQQAEDKEEHKSNIIKQRYTFIKNEKYGAINFVDKGGYFIIELPDKNKAYFIDEHCYEPFTPIEGCVVPKEIPVELDRGIGLLYGAALLEQAPKINSKDIYPDIPEYEVAYKDNVLTRKSNRTFDPTWHFSRNGVKILERYAGNEVSLDLTKYPEFFAVPGKYEVYITETVYGYHRVSNIITWEVKE